MEAQAKLTVRVSARVRSDIRSAAPPCARSASPAPRAACSWLRRSSPRRVAAFSSLPLLSPLGLFLLLSLKRGRKRGGGAGCGFLPACFAFCASRRCQSRACFCPKSRACELLPHSAPVSPRVRPQNTSPQALAARELRDTAQMQLDTASKAAARGGARKKARAARAGVGCALCLALVPLPAFSWAVALGGGWGLRLAGPSSAASTRCAAAARAPSAASLA